MPKTKLEKRKGVCVKLLPKEIEALEVCSELFQCDKIDLIEMGLSVVFQNAVKIVSEDNN